MKEIRGTPNVSLLAISRAERSYAGGIVATQTKVQSDRVKKQKLKEAYQYKSDRRKELQMKPRCISHPSYSVNFFPPSQSGTNISTGPLLPLPEP